MMQGKVAHNRPLLSDPSISLAHSRNLSTSDLLLKKNHLRILNSNFSKNNHSQMEKEGVGPIYDFFFNFIFLHFTTISKGSKFKESVINL